MTSYNTDGYKELDNAKAKINAPCGFYDREKRLYPAVNCALDCEHCGWNPAEKTRRAEEGEWAEVRGYSIPAGTINNRHIQPKTIDLPRGVKQLRFKRAGPAAGLAAAAG